MKHSSKNLSTPPPLERCGCQVHAQKNDINLFSTATLGDIVYDFDRSALQDWKPMQAEVGVLSLKAEQSRTMRISEDWARWFWIHPLDTTSNTI
jgi:hypothetical protein